jgi:hypothetical protein
MQTWVRCFLPTVSSVRGGSELGTSMTCCGQGVNHNGPEPHLTLPGDRDMDQPFLHLLCGVSDEDHSAMGSQTPCRPRMSGCYLENHLWTLPPIKHMQGLRSPSFIEFHPQMQPGSHVEGSSSCTSWDLFNSVQNIPLFLLSPYGFYVRVHRYMTSYINNTILYH